MTGDPQRDRWGRPLIVPPGGGKPVPYARATTLAKTLDDEGALATWKMRMVAVGLARRADLIALASTTTDKKQLDDITQQALDAAASGARANIGTALHALVEQINRGEQPPNLLDSLTADIAAYRDGVKDLRLSMPETFVVNDSWQVAGTFDFLVESNGMLLVGDLKTGTDLKYSWRSIAVQLAVYANSEWIYDPATDTRSPMPEVDKRLGVVVHLPAGEGRCQLFTVDIAEGYGAAEKSLWCRGWRKQALSEPWTPVPIGQGLHEAPSGRVDALRARAAALIAAGHGDQLALRWPAGVPTFRAGLNEPAHLDQIEELLWAVEAKTGAPFPEGDPLPPEPPSPSLPAPAAVVDPADVLPAEVVAALRARLSALPAAAGIELSQLAVDASNTGRPIGLSTPCLRNGLIVEGLLNIAEHPDTDPAALVVDIMIGWVTTPDPTATTGARLGALTLDEAKQFAARTKKYATDRIPTPANN